MSGSKSCSPDLQRRQTRRGIGPPGGLPDAIDDFAFRIQRAPTRTSTLQTQPDPSRCVRQSQGSTNSTPCSTAHVTSWR